MFKISDDRSPEQRLVIIQCDSGHLNGDLIACARYRIYDLRAKADKDLITHILFIIHLPQQAASSSFIGFQGDPWISFHIDDLRQPSYTVVSTKEAINSTISELFLLNQPNNRVYVESDLDDDEFFDAQENWENVEETRKKENTGFRKDIEIQSVVTMAAETIESDSETEFEDCLPYFSSCDAIITESVPLRQYKLCVAASQDFLSQTDKPCKLMPPLKSQLFKCLPSYIQAAASRLKDFNTSRTIKRVEILVNLVPEELPSIPGLLP